jgi:hypothetical protein
MTLHMDDDMLLLSLMADLRAGEHHAGNAGNHSRTGAEDHRGRRSANLTGPLREYWVRRENESVEHAEDCHCGQNIGEPTFCMDCGANTCRDCADCHECEGEAGPGR